MIGTLTNASSITPELIVAGAANLSDVFNDIKPIFEKENSCKLTYVLGATGLLSAQIEQGAPFDVFAAADVSTIEKLEKKNLIISETKSIYARGRIVLWQRKDAPFQCNTLQDVARLGIKRIAIANPEFAPYGIAARESLQKSKFWDSIKDKLIYGENIRSTKQYAETGNVDVAIIALSLAKDSIGRYFVIDSTFHSPINQEMAVIKSTHQVELAKKFCNYILSPTCKPIWEKYGYEIPMDSPNKTK